MAEPRRVPFVSLSPMKPRESAGTLIVEQQQQQQQQQQNSPFSATQRSQPTRPQLTGTQQQSRPLQQTPQRPQREAAVSSSMVEEAGFMSKAEEERPSAEETVRLELALSDPTDQSCSEFSYRDLLQSEQRRVAVENAGQIPCRATAQLHSNHRGSLNHHNEVERLDSDLTGQKKSVKLSESVDPFNDEERERLEVEKMARKFEAKYGRKSHRHRKDRMQDLIDIGYGYDETDPFIDNSEAYDELVPASLTTKYGGFYINTGTLQFRQASDSENEDFLESKKHKSSKLSHLKDDDRSIKKRKRKDELSEKEKPSRKLKVQKPLGVVAFNAYKPEKKKKKLYKDSLSLAAMIRKFQREKDAMRKIEPKLNQLSQSIANPPPKSNDLFDITLGSDPVLAIFGGGSERELLQEAESALEMLGDIDFDKLLDSASNDSPTASDLGENGNIGQSTNQSHAQIPKQIPKQIPSFPEGLPTQLEKRIDDLRVAAKMFDEEGRKKFFTQEMNTILLDIELQLQELSPSNRNGVYGYIEAFVPCTKDTLIKRLRKLHLNIQDDRLKEPLQRLKVAISNVMPGQLNKYQEDCQAHQAKSTKHQGDDERDRNPSEEDDEEKPGKRVMGPRKKFYWDETLRTLLCNLVKIKLGCYELEPSKSQSAEDYLKNFMETEVKPLWPKGWMQSRMLFKESRSVHNHLTSAPAKKKVIVAPKPKVKESSPKKEQKTLVPSLAIGRTPMNAAVLTGVPSTSSCISSETICLDDSLDESLSFKTPSLDSISEALAVLNNGTTAASSSHIETPTSRPRVALREEKLASIMSKLPLSGPKKTDPLPHTSSLIAGQSAPVPKKHQNLAPAHSAVVSGLIAGSSIHNPKVSLETLPAKLLQQGMQRSLQSEVSSSSAPAKAKALSASQTKSAGSSTSTPLSSTPIPLISSSHTHVSSSSSLVQNSSSLQTVKVQPSLQQNYVTPLQATISKSHTNPVVRLTSSPQISSTSLVIKTPEKTVGYRPPSSPSTSSGQHTPVSRSAASSTSTNIMAKNAQGTNLAFKSPYSMVPSPKLITSSSSSSGNPISPNAAHNKVSSGINVARPSPTVSPIPSGRGTAGIPGLKNSSVSPKISSSSPKLVTTTIRQQSPSQNMPASSPVHSPIPSSVPSPKVSSPILQSQSPKQSNSSSKPVNPTQPGQKTTVLSSAMNVPISRANQNATVTNRTHLSGAAGSGAVGATKQPISHRQPPASGAPVTAATVQSAASLLANTSPLTLMAAPLSVTNPNVTTTSLSPFGMLGGLVPVNMPFQFPLELLTFGSDTAAATSPCSTSAAFHHNITQNLLKGLQTTATHTATISHSSLSARLQQAFTDGGQSKGDSKPQRKNP
ncbi:ubinuclein-2 isoform X1 [Aquarana catesbeiana]|uniref:ubinuclein-2 isoform X1 n=1 Tax=Aquarana catesbeiana TaxID=8400 RepID=UPI003CCA46D8